ncbi:MAG: hypothetical protein ABI120_02540 [Gemmatimonadaceae bacterium]
MAIDLTLMEVAKSDGVGLLRVYGWSNPTISFGRNERVVGVYEARELTAAGLEFVRRPTGGRALLHSREVTYSVAMPLSDQSRWPVAYEAVNQRLLAAMQALGVPALIARASAQLAEVTDHAVASNSPSHDQHVVCFSGIAPGEIAVGDRKLVASSVWRDRAAYLQHGSILIHDDQSTLRGLLGARVAPLEPGATLSRFMPRLSDEAIVNRAEIALINAFGHCGKTVRWSIPKEVREQVDVTRSALSNSAWLWRR